MEDAAHGSRVPVPRAPDWRAAAVRRDEGDDYAQDYGKVRVALTVCHSRLGR